MACCCSLRINVIYYYHCSGCSAILINIVLSIVRTMWIMLWSYALTCNTRSSLRINLDTSVYTFSSKSSRCASHAQFSISFSFSTFLSRFFIRLFFSFQFFCLFSTLFSPCYSSSRQQLSQGHTVLYEELGKVVEVQPLNLADYAQEKVYTKVKRAVDPKHHLRVIDETNCFSLAKLFSNYTPDYARDLVNIWFSAAVNPAGLPYGTAVHHVDDEKFFKDACHMVMLNGRYKYRLLKVVRDGDHLECPAESFCMRYVLCIDEKHSTSA